MWLPCEGAPVSVTIVGISPVAISGPRAGSVFRRISPVAMLSADWRCAPPLEARLARSARTVVSGLRPSSPRRRLGLRRASPVAISGPFRRREGLQRVGAGADHTATASAADPTGPRAGPPELGGQSRASCPSFSWSGSYARPWCSARSSVEQRTRRIRDLELDPRSRPRFGAVRRRTRLRTTRDDPLHRCDLARNNRLA